MVKSSLLLSRPVTASRELWPMQKEGQPVPPTPEPTNFTMRSQLTQGPAMCGGDSCLGLAGVASELGCQEE